MSNELKIVEPITGCVDTVVEQPMDFTVVATNPEEMQYAQRSLILWSARKIQATREELKEAETELEIATKSKWRTHAWKIRVARLKPKIEFYKKIKTALEAGYYIIPPFPIDIFAIRTNLEKPNSKFGYIDSTLSRQSAIENIPTCETGDGEYVSSKSLTTQSKLMDQEYDKESGKLTGGNYYHFPKTFDPVDFPFKIAKSVVMSETAKAMALKVFDQVGIMGGQSGFIPEKAAATMPDPIVCGQILMPHKRKAPVTFFIAWWLDTKTL